MLTLGITTGQAIEAALLGSGVKRSAAGSAQALDALLGCITRILAESGRTLDAVSLIAVCTGPGSFSGLRIGVSFAKAVAQARGLPLVGVSAYDVVEETLPPAYPRIALIEAKRGYFYARIVEEEGAAARFVHGDDRSGSDILTLAPQPVLSAQRAFFSPGERAEIVARRGRRLHDAGAVGDWRKLVIDYGQRPSAEVKRFKRDD